MIEVDVDASTAWSVTAGVAAFLAAWAAKHLLDATALPSIKDRWARLFAGRAKKRAEWLAANYRDERRIIASPRHLLIVLHRDQASRFGLYVLNIAYGVVGLIIWLEFDFGGQKAFAAPVSAMFFAGCSWLYLRLVMRSHANFRRLLRSPRSYRRDLVTQLSSLLSSAGMSTKEIGVWLAEEVPPLAKPAPKPIAARGDDEKGSRIGELRIGSKLAGLGDALKHIEQPAPLENKRQS